MNAIPRELHSRTDLDRITMLDWLQGKAPTPAAIERYWREVLVSAVNEELDRMAALHGFQVFWLGMIARADAYEMGVPDVPLRELYDEASLACSASVRIHHRSGGYGIDTAAGEISGIVCGDGRHMADYYVSCLPFERLQILLPGLPVDWSAFRAFADYRHPPLVHRPITDLPHATLLDPPLMDVQQREGRYFSW